MNILLMNGLPEEYEGIPLSADFRNMIQVDLILHDPAYSDIEKTISCLHQLYPSVPADAEKAIAGLEWFFMRGNVAKKENEASCSTKKEKRAFDFGQDANFIYAAFYATYGISLTTIDFLHWWEFMALFEGLPETTLIQRILYWRTADVSGLPKAEKKHVLKMRKMFALKEGTKKALSLEEIEHRAKEDIARRFAQAEKWAENSR